MALEQREITSASEIAFRSHRRFLFWSMADAGFVNYPEELFHFDPFQARRYRSQFAVFTARKWGVQTALLANVPPAKPLLDDRPSALLPTGAGLQRRTAARHECALLDLG